MKRISAQTVTVCVLAILFGLVSAYIVRRQLADHGPQGIEVVVAKINLGRFARVRPDRLEVVRLPESQVPEGALRNIGQLSGRLVSDTILAGVPVTEALLFEIGKEPVMADSVPAGYRAVTINVSEENALAGVLLPESLIDISLTTNGNHPDIDGDVTATLVRAVRVLATSQQRFRFAENSRRELRTVTVAVTPEQANKLILGQRYGALSVILRGAEENPSLAHNSMDLVSPNDLLGLPPRRRVGPVTSQIWRGTSVSQVSFAANEVQESRQATIARESTKLRAPVVGFKTSN